MRSHSARLSSGGVAGGKVRNSPCQTRSERTGVCTSRRALRQKQIRCAASTLAHYSRRSHVPTVCMQRSEWRGVLLRTLRVVAQALLFAKTPPSCLWFTSYNGTRSTCPFFLSIGRKTVRKISVPTHTLYEIHHIAFTHAFMVTSRSPSG